MRLPIFGLALCALAACAPPAQVSKNSPPTGVGFGAGAGVMVLSAPVAATSMARDFMDLSFAMENGRGLGVFSRFEGPVTVGLAEGAPPTAARDLAALVARLQNEAGIDIATTTGPASITIAFAPRADLRRLAPTAACFVVPNVTSLAEYRRKRGTDAVDWANVTRRDRAAIFIPADTSPQEVRDCLHEELAQALGPLNDLYRLSDSVFNDDNFHSTLTGFDMDILRLTYSPKVASGMTPDEVASRLFGTLAGASPAAPGDWSQAIEAAMGRKGPVKTRLAAAERAVAIASASGWQDSRMGFSQFAVGRLAAASDPARTMSAFDAAAAIYSRLPGAALQLAHIDLQYATIALASGQAAEAVTLADRAIPRVSSYENPALLATLMLIKAEALDRLGNTAEAARLRLDSAALARYGFGPDSVIQARMQDIAALADRAGNG
jgi:Protein of unknown function (DUF2927)